MQIFKLKFENDTAWTGGCRKLELGLIKKKSNKEMFYKIIHLS